jgi:uncharacterized membrane protein (DUF4010 family)
MDVVASSDIMDYLSNLEPWWRLAAALLIGALIGLEREFVQQRDGAPDFAGIRTFSMIALLGAVAAYLSSQVSPLLFLGAYLGLALLVLVSTFGAIYRGEREGITTQVVALLVPLLGALVVWGEAELAAAIGVITALLLAFKPRLHEMARRMSTGDLRATLEFALVTAVILPLLPNEGMGPFNVINPFQMWLLVVFVSGIGLLGYVLMKVFGAELGVGLTGVLGGLVSSTATTVSFAGRSKESPDLSPVLASGIILSSSLMFPRVLAEVAVVYPPLLAKVTLPMGAMLLAGLAAVAFLWRRHGSHKHDNGQKVEFTNPLRLTTAISFGLAFSIVRVGVRAASEFFGAAGVYVSSGVAGLTGVDAITLSVSELASYGQIEPQVAAIAVVLAAVVNTGAKAVLAWVLGSARLRATLVRAFGFILLVGGVTSAAVL